MSVHRSRFLRLDPFALHALHFIHNFYLTSEYDNRLSVIISTMSNFKDEERINELRKRLYDRGTGPEKREEYELTDRPTDAPKTWSNPPKPKVEESAAATAQPESITDVSNVPMAPVKKKKSYRVKIVLAGFIFFFLALAVSSFFFITGDNTISGENITVSLSGPFTIGGGEVMPIQVGVTNQNAVPIDSATLIVRYPRGTRSATESGTELFVERLPLDSIDSGETLNIPLRAVVFGEENEEKTIEAEVEYRVMGSNSTFEKKAEPLRYKIGASPIVVSVDALHKVSSGQESEIELTISSNAPNTLEDIIVKADFPSGFTYTSAEPEPASGRNIWVIDTLEPEENATIQLTGVVVGKETDEYAMHFNAGVAAGNDPYSIDSILATAFTEFVIEQPFIDVALEINGDASSAVSIDKGEDVLVDITIKNVLPDTIYDASVALSVSGNALSDYTVDVNDGFYDSRNNQVTWDSGSFARLKEIKPNSEVRIRASFEPDPDIDITPQLAFDVDARANRVSEGRVTEQLVGTAAGAVRVASVASIITEVGRDTSSFTEMGPLPPVAEQATTYTLTLFVQNGSNDIGDVELTAALPQYVRWLDETTGAGNITYNDVSRTVTWNVGDVNANQSKIAAFQVSLLPSISQIGTTPTLIGEQRLRGTDRFTGTVVRASYPARTTKLAEEAGYDEKIGVVVE